MVGAGLAIWAILSLPHSPSSVALVYWWLGWAGLGGGGGGALSMVREGAWALTVARYSQFDPTWVGMGETSLNSLTG